MDRLWLDYVIFNVSPLSMSKELMLISYYAILCYAWFTLEKTSLEKDL